MRQVIRAIVWLALFGALAGPAAAQTTGSLAGRVTDEQGQVLPGASVEATSPVLQGTRTATADAGGRYRLQLLPPGEYTVTFSMPGFGREVQKGVPVGLNRETTLDANLHLTAKAEVTVTSEAAAIDTASGTLGTSFDTRAIRTLPTQRNYSSVTQVTPGVSSDANPSNADQATITVYGSSGAENAFFIDGVNTTGSEYGFQGTELNFEFIQAVDVKTGGYEAEYGKSTGGIINVITKSGGNAFHGDVFGYYDADGLQRSSEAVVSTNRVDGYKKTDFGVGLGGYFVKDRLWFFGAYDRVDNSADNVLPSGTRAGQIAVAESTRDLGAGKLTFNATSGQSFVATYFQDPREDTGAISDAAHSLIGDPITYEGKKELGGRDWALRYQGLFGASWLVTAGVSRHTEENSVGPASGAGDAVQFRDVENNFYQRGGFGLIEKKDFSRTTFGATATRFFSQHEVKFGFEYEKEDAEVTRRFSGGQQVDVFANPANPARPIYGHFYWTTPTATVANAPVSALRASPEHKVTTLYLQDRWNPLPNLTVNAGVRWDRQEIIDASGTRQIDLKNDFAPRLGVVWDPEKNRKSRLYASYGRYYEQIPMDLVIRSFSYERQARIFNFSPTATTPDPQAEADLERDSAIFGGFTEPTDPNLRNQFLHEGILGYEREVAPDVSVGIKGVYRTYGEVIEDFLCADDGTYCIGNPGKGIMERIFTLDYARTFEAPDPERVYKAVQLDVTKRFSNGWQATASYIYSKLEGNFDGLYAPFTNVGADPNISAAFDYYDFFTNGRDLNVITNDGPLSNDRRHQFKLSGLYVFPFRLALGLQAYVRSGTPVTRYGYSDAYGRYEFFLTNRGGEGRTPTNFEADLHLGYPIKAGPVEVNVLVDVFNLLNAQRAVLLDQRYGFQEADNFESPPVNTGYLKPVLRTPPTTVRLGLRVSF